MPGRFQPSSFPELRLMTSLAAAIIAATLNFSVHAADTSAACGTSGEDIHRLRKLKSAKLSAATAASPRGRPMGQTATSTTTELPVFTVLLELAGSGSSFSEETINELPGLIYGTPSSDAPNGPALSVARRFDIESYGKLALTGLEGSTGSANDIIGPIVVDDFDCSHPADSIQNLINDHESSVDWSPLESGAQLLVLFPSMSGLGCTYAGVATWGSLSSDDFIQSEVEMPLAVSLRVKQRTIAHELGHTLGAGHAGVVECHGDAWNSIPYAQNSAQFTGDDQCGTRAYGDPRGMMGLAGNQQIIHSGAIIKEQLGFLSSDDNAPDRVSLVTESGNYQLLPLSEENLFGVKALKFPSGMHQFGYVEIRSPYNADGTLSADEAAYDNLFLSHSNMFDGAHISRSHIAWGPTASLLLDGEATSSDPPLSSLFTSQFALPYTRSFTDPMSGTEVTMGFPPHFGPVDVHVELGRTDFTGPSITNLQVSANPSDPCSATVSAHVSDPADLSAIELIMVNVEFVGSQVFDVPLPGDDGLIEFEIDRTMTFLNSAVRLNAWDNASSVGLGLADDNISHSESVSIPFNGGCDPTAPEVVVLSPTVNQEFSGPVRINFQATENETAFKWVSYYIGGGPGSGPSGEGGAEQFSEATQYFEVDREHALPAGDYWISIYVQDIYSNLSNVSQLPFTVLPRESFLRGDVNDDGRVDIADPIALFGHLFADTDIACLSAADANDDGAVTIADAIFLFAYLRGQATLPAPSREAGSDPSADALACDWAAP